MTFIDDNSESMATIIGIANDFQNQDTVRIEIQGADFVEMMDYKYAPRFNRQIPAKKIRIRFQNSIRVVFSPLQS